jgi:hypothetical protein
VKDKTWIDRNEDLLLRASRFMTHDPVPKPQNAWDGPQPLVSLRCLNKTGAIIRWSKPGERENRACKYFYSLDRHFIVWILNFDL